MLIWENPGWAVHNWTVAALMNQFRCKPLKSAMRLGRKTLALGFSTVTVEKPHPSQRKPLFNYGHQDLIDRRFSIDESGDYTRNPSAAEAHRHQRKPQPASP